MSDELILQLTAIVTGVMSLAGMVWLAVLPGVTASMRVQGFIVGAFIMPLMIFPPAWVIIALWNFLIVHAIGGTP